MTKVYFSKNIEKIINNTDFTKLGKNVAVKVHFGEMGCDTYMDPELVRKIYKKIESLGKKATLVECNVLYKGSRTNTTDHIKTALSHGFTDMNIDILDDEKGEEYIDINGCKIGAGIKKYDSMMVISHFKGHAGTGFGAAIKNVGMGIGSRAGKLHMHSQVKPIISEKDCTGCSICARNCDVDAIEIVDGKAIINLEKCVGCAMCIAVCPSGAAQVPWGSSTNEYLQEKIAQYTAATLSLFENCIYINILEKITKLCDCYGEKQKVIMDDVGIVASTNISAVDMASLDLVNECSCGKFDKINNVDNKNQIKFASDNGLGDGKYELIEIN